MHPVIRKPSTQWLYTILTGGLYLFYWVWRISCELNNAEEKVVLNISLWKKILFVILALTISSLAYLKYANDIKPFLVMFTSYIIFIFYVFNKIGNYIKSKDKEHNLGISYSNFTFIFLLFVIANTGVIYMQTALNKIITREQNAS